MADLKITLFKLENLRKGKFLSRPNRFVSEIEYNKVVKLAHIHDPGRLTELLIKGSEILFAESKGKLDYYVKAVKAKNEWVIIDTSLHSKIASLVFQYLTEFSKVQDIRREVPLGKSRIDFMLDGRYLEVKGVTLVEDGLALFPDAPTERGTRHVREIIKYNGMLLFLIFREASCLKPNYETDPKFFKALSEAKEKNIKIFAIRISFDGETIYYRGNIPLCDF
ncbi:MAG: DNA/RNA nuclease SfsA [Candidatus Lokiarchaeota archaeon]|nr:DNA/RNA nuclease SfsA [Candidatus Lokiarchaeota archaeon]